MVHQFDLARFLACADISEVYGMSHSDDHIAAEIFTLHMANASTCLVDICVGSDYAFDQRIEVYGSKGEIRCEDESPTTTSLVTDKGIVTDSPEDFSPNQLALKDFLDHPYDTRIADVLTAMEVAYLSLEQNRPVKLSEISSNDTIRAQAIA